MELKVRMRLYDKSKSEAATSKQWLKRDLHASLVECQLSELRGLVSGEALPLTESRGLPFCHPSSTVLIRMRCALAFRGHRNI